MNYALNVSQRAKSELRLLDAWLQEEVLDDLDAIATGKIPLSTDTHDVVRIRDNVKYYVFIDLTADDKTNVLEIHSLGSVSRLMPQ